jgi:hypothetical protein
MKPERTRKLRLPVLGIALLVVCVSCATAPGAPKQPAPAQQPEVKAPAVPPPVVQKETPPPETFFVHTIKWSGESLSIIAAWYTGDLQNWKAIAEANPQINPDKVHDGMKVRIPERIMTTKAPMTKEHVDGFYPKAKKAPAKKPSAPEETDQEPKLFGPKDLPQK